MLAMQQEIDLRMAHYFEGAPALFFTMRQESGDRIAMPFLVGRIASLPGLMPEAVAEDIGPLLELCHPDDTAPLLAELHRSGRDMTPCCIEFRLGAPVIGQKVIELKAVPRRDDNSPGSVEWNGFMHDITGRKRMEDELRTSEREYRTLTENLPVPVMRYDVQGRLRYMNPAAERAARIKASDLVGRSVGASGLLSPEAIQICRNTIDEVLATQTARDFELMPDAIVTNPQGHYSVRIVPDPAPNDSTGVLVIGFEITALKHAENTLHDREAFLASLLDTIPIPVVYKDREGRYLGLNKACETFVGTTKDQLIGKSVFDLYPRELAEFHHAVDETLFEQGGMQQYEARSMNVQGLMREALVHKAVFTDKQGNAAGLICAIQDITERKRMEEMLVAREQEFRSLTENSPDYIVRYDRDGRLSYLNTALLRHLELDGAEEVLGKRPGEVWPDGRFDELEQAAAQAVESGAATTIELCDPSAAGGLHFSQIRIVPERDAAGHIVGTIAFGRDITAIRVTERRLAHFIDNLPGMAYTFRLTPDGHASFPFVSPAIKEIYGLTPEDVKDDFMAIHMLAHPEDRVRIDAAIAESARTMTPFRVESRVCRPGRSERWIDARSVPEREADGSILWYGLMLDITERKQAEQKLTEALEFTEGIINAIPDILFEVNREGRYLNAWTRNPELLAQQKEALLGKTVHEVLSPETAAATMKAIAEADEKGVAYGHVFRIDLPHGPAWFEHSISKKSGDSPGDVRYLVLSRDVTERKRMEAALALREREFRTLIENSPDTVARYGRDLRRLYVNPAFAALVEGGAAALIGKRPTESPGGSNAAIYEENLSEVFASGKEREFELKWAHKDGREYCSLIRLTPEFGQDGKVESILAVGRDISELNAFRQRIHQMAFYDSLTALPNRALFNDRLRQMIVDASWHGQTAGVMMVDMDRFKEINDTMGHAVGDELLREAAARLSACVRAYDTVARLGGDEFAILLPEIRNSDDLGRIAGKLLGAFGERFLLDGKEVFVSCSIGIAVYPNDSTEADDLVKYADSAMYFAKRSGRNNFRFYSKDLTASAQDRLMLESELRHAVERNQLELHYQPKVLLQNGMMIGSEALLRWRHPRLGMVPPNRFIQIAEDTGLIIDLGKWVLREACRTASEWNTEGKPLHKIAINLSARQFQPQNLVMTVADILNETACRPEWIELEITESLLLDEDGKTLDTLSAFRAMGISIAIDDFGTGYSALSYLTRFPIDTLKIDKSFIHSVTTDNYHAELVRAILSIARSLGQEVVAEGVETVEQAAFLKANGCQVAQGFLYSKPLPKVEIASLPRRFDCGNAAAEEGWPI